MSSYAATLSRKSIRRGWRELFGTTLIGNAENLRRGTATLNSAASRDEAHGCRGFPALNGGIERLIANILVDLIGAFDCARPESCATFVRLRQSEKNPAWGEREQCTDARTRYELPAIWCSGELREECGAWRDSW